MSLFTWSPQIAVGIAQVDQEHRGLFDAINAFHDAMLAGQGSDALADLLTKLIEYTKTHFRHEEEMLRKYGYPDFAAHKQQHDLLTAKVLELQAGLKAGTTKASIETMRFVKDWLVNHIMKVDMAYKSFLVAKGVT
jgi:hemerythrin